jgi:hypothetical protein
MRITKRQLRRIIREEHDASWGMGHDEDSRTHPGEEDYTGHTGDESKTHAGEDYAGGDVEHKAMTAMAAIHDLASAAGVELETSVAGPSDVAPEEDLGMVTMESRRRTKRRTRNRLRRIIREERRKMHEDSIADELDHLRKNKEDDLEHIDALEKDIEDDREEMKDAEEARKDESFRRRRLKSKIRRIVRENTRPTRRKVRSRRRRR